MHLTVSELFRLKKWKKKSMHLNHVKTLKGLKLKPVFHNKSFSSVAELFFPYVIYFGNLLWEPRPCIGNPLRRWSKSGLIFLRAIKCLHNKSIETHTAVLVIIMSGPKGHWHFWSHSVTKILQTVVNTQTHTHTGLCSLFRTLQWLLFIVYSLTLNPNLNQFLPHPNL